MGLLGGPNKSLMCPYCSAGLFPGETLKCCKKGRVRLPPVRVPPAMELLLGRGTLNHHQRKLSELYLRFNRELNNSFQMVVVMGTAGPVFSEKHFVPGMRCPPQGLSHFSGPAVVLVNGDYYFRAQKDADYKAATLFFIDAATSVPQRMEHLRQTRRKRNAGREVSIEAEFEELVALLTAILHEHNPFVQQFRSAMNMHIAHGRHQFTFTLADPQETGAPSSTHNLPTAMAEVAIAVHLPEGQDVPTFNVVFQKVDATGKVTGTYTKLHEGHPLRHALQYPLLFVMGDRGYTYNEIPYCEPILLRRVVELR